jgi:hypothetical protein
VSAPTETITIDVQAFIDGRDLLVIQGNTLQWDHLDYSAVGTWNGSNATTNITTTLNGVPQNQYNWLPTWSAPLNTAQWSSVFTGLTPALPSSNMLSSGDMSVSLDTISARDSLTIYQLPTASNNYALILDFNDDPSSGATWYDALITITFPLPATRWTNTQGGNWSVASNWGSGIPTANLEAEVDSPGTYSVAITKNAIAYGLSINDAQATVTDSSGALTLAGTGGANGALNIDAGTFVLNGGGLKAGTIFIGSGGVLQIAKGAYTGTNALSETITNNGSITDKVSATITGNLGGAGTVLVQNNANLTITGNLTGNESFSLANSAHVDITTAINGFTTFTIANNAVLEVGTADFGSVTFASGSNGTVKFDQPLTQPSTCFSGAIGGLTPSTKIDLADLSFVSGKMNASYSSSTNELTVSNGTNSVSFLLTGNFTNSTWTLSKDATGGTLVVDPPATTSPPTSTLDSLVAVNLPTSSNSGLTDAQTATGLHNLGGSGLDHVVALFNQFMAAGFPEQHSGSIATNALSQVTTNEQNFLAAPHHG